MTCWVAARDMKISSERSLLFQERGAVECYALVPRVELGLEDLQGGIESFVVVVGHAHDVLNDTISSVCGNVPHTHVGAH